MKGGKYLVIAHGTPGEVAVAHKILETTELDELRLHSDVSVEVHPTL